MKKLSINIPPVCIWGTLLSTNLFIVRTTVSSNTKYAAHRAAYNVDKCVTTVKEKASNLVKKTKETKKDTPEVVQENTAESVVEVVNEETYTQVVKGDQNVNENVEMIIPVQEGEKTLDFSNAEKAVIYENPVEEEEPVLQPVTQADLDEIMKKTNLGPNKKSSKSK